MNRIVAALFLFFLVPHSAFAASASISAVQPADTVTPGTRVTFGVTSLGFTSNPTYYLTDSFPAGATNVNIDQWGNFSWTPNTSDIGSHGITVTVSDAEGHEATASKTIAVSKPSIVVQSVTPKSATVNIGAPVSFSVVPSAFVSPRYALSDSFSNSSLLYTAIDSSGAFYWTPVTQDVGVHTITVTGSDAQDNVATTKVEVTVLPNVSLTVSTSASCATVSVGQTFTCSVVAVGFENPIYAIADGFDTASSNFPTIDTSGKVTWTPKANDIGSHTITIEVSDSAGRKKTLSFIIKVTAQQPISQTLTVVQETLPTPPPAQTGTKTTNTPAKNTTGPTKQNASVSVTTPTPTTSSVPEQTTPVVEEIASTDIPIEPTQSFGSFLLHGVVSFFASIFSFFK